MDGAILPFQQLIGAHKVFKSQGQEPWSQPGTASTLHCHTNDREMPRTGMSEAWSPAEQCASDWRRLTLRESGLRWLAARLSEEGSGRYAFPTQGGGRCPTRRGRQRQDMPLQKQRLRRVSSAAVACACERMAVCRWRWHWRWRIRHSAQHSATSRHVWCDKHTPSAQKYRLWGGETPKAADKSAMSILWCFVQFF